MSAKSVETFLSGIPISGGIVIGDVLVAQYSFQKKDTTYKIKESDIPQEIGRIKEALQVLLLVSEYSEKFLREYYGSSVAELFEMQRMMLEDRQFRQDIYKIIESKKYKAETAVRTALDKFKHSLLESESQYIRERVSDINDLKTSFIDALMNPVSLFDEKRYDRDVMLNGKRNNVMIVQELTPRLVIEQKMERTGAIIAEKGGKTSHAAILCRALGITAVSGIKNIHTMVTREAKVLVNGDTGQVILFPKDKTIQRIMVSRSPKAIIKHADGVKKEFTGLKIMANINFATDVSDILESQADGIGLYRTEFEFMVAERFLDEDEQYVRYKSVIKATKGLPVYIRLLDLGRDKNLPEHHFNVGRLTKTGSFGAQFLLDNPDVFKTQAKAITRASECGPVCVIYPMIANLQQFIELKELFLHATSGMNCENIKHGVMLELPSACLTAGLILRVADFGSIGTNDLISYLFGIERDSDSDATRQAADSPMLWKLIKSMSKVAQSQNKPLLFCGELAKDPKCIEKLIKLGINAISVTPKLIHGLRNEVSRLYGNEKKALDEEIKIEKELSVFR